MRARPTLLLLVVTALLAGCSEPVDATSEPEAKPCRARAGNPVSEGALKRAFRSEGIRLYRDDRCYPEALVSLSNAADPLTPDEQDAARTRDGHIFCEVLAKEWGSLVERFVWRNDPQPTYVRVFNVDCAVYPQTIEQTNRVESALRRLPGVDPGPSVLPSGDAIPYSLSARRSRRAIVQYRMDDSARRLEHDRVDVPESRLEAPVLTFLGRSYAGRLERDYAYTDGATTITCRRSSSTSRRFPRVLGVDRALRALDHGAARPRLPLPASRRSCRQARSIRPVATAGRRRIASFARSWSRRASPAGGAPSAMRASGSSAEADWSEARRHSRAGTRSQTD